MGKKVMLGMSGGVDSSVAALLLLEQGYSVTGVTLRLRPDEWMQDEAEGGCCSLADVEDARRVAYKLGMEHIVLNFTDIFQRDVIDYFAKEYAVGRTPNPCIACNRYIKFNAMLRRAAELDFDYVATGHYALIEQNNDSRFLLKKSPAAKDQSYVLYSLTQYQLAHTLLPLGSMNKPEVRQLAEKAQLPVAHKPDSQEICFVEDNNYAAFLERYTGDRPQPGKFIDRSGKILGSHKGLSYYTIGQRKGLGLSFGEPMYVCGINADKNEVVLGPEGSQYASGLIADDLNWIAFDAPDGKIRTAAKVRYQAKPASADLIAQSDGSIRLKFDEPQRSVTPGQAVVFYDGDLVVGGGTITEAVY